ncbi:MAG: hypothetical protein BWK75_04675 [Candidatus Altiarchaeales archaeon A3]|nr:MAG: hypothetical protein BWK75_04675 [Candidatus Altiarchaeales archaeon A3]
MTKFLITCDAKNTGAVNFSGNLLIRFYQAVTNTLFYNSDFDIIGFSILPGTTCSHRIDGYDLTLPEGSYTLVLSWWDTSGAASVVITEIRKTLAVVVTKAKLTTIEAKDLVISPTSVKL